MIFTIVVLNPFLTINLNGLGISRLLWNNFFSQSKLHVGSVHK